MHKKHVKSYIVMYLIVRYAKAGFKSITISEAVYEKFYDTYDQSKTDLAVKGVRGGGIRTHEPLRDGIAHFRS